MRDPIEYENDRSLRTEWIPAAGEDAVHTWIRLGEWLRQGWPNIFVDACLREAAKLDVAIITDLRHWNEFDGVKQQGGLRYRIDRDVPSVPGGIDDVLAECVDWTATFDNNSSRRALYEKMETLSHEIAKSVS